ncbi:MAG: T9SS type A sorting domain-containing protein [Ignavibacteriales bacterium]|nr:T9SS type A sorting domain-containing protein [Ignavibacteriales bacterium]
MKKALLLFAVLLFSVSLVSAQTYNVTFKVNMNIELNKGRLTATDGVYARGNFNDWGESQLTDADTDGIYDAVIAVDASKLEVGTKLNYKFYHKGANGTNGGWESDVNGGNRTAEITADKALDAAFFNSGSYSTGGYYTSVASDVTFNVNMTLPINMGMDPATATVGVAGNFNGWNTTATTLTDADGDKIYSGTVSVTSGELLVYKFIYNQNGTSWEGAWDGEDDIFGNDKNRIYGVIDGANSIERFWNNQDPNVQLGDGNISFTMDMSVLEEIGVFDQVTDLLQIRGGFNGWSDSDPSKSHMNQDVFNPSEWYLTIPFEKAEVNSEQTFKYYAVLANPGIWTDSWERPLSTGGGDRSAPFLADPNQVVEKVYYDDVQPYLVVESGKFVQITFRVDMTDAYDPNKQAVPMEAADRLFWRSRQPLFQRVLGWTDNDTQQNFELFDPDGDKIYEGTLAVNGPAFNAFEYIYMYQKASDATWQREPTALGTTYSGRTRYIPMPAARQFQQPYTAPLDSWLNQADKSSQAEPIPIILSVEELGTGIPTTYSLDQNYPNPFNPSTTIRFAISGDEKVSLKIYNVLGQQVSELLNQEMKAGSYEYKFNAANLSSGIYFYTINAGTYTATRKMIYLK